MASSTSTSIVVDFVKTDNKEFQQKGMLQDF